MSDINVKIEDAQPINVSLSEAQPINIDLADAQPINITLAEPQPIEVSIVEAQPINVSLGEAINMYSGSNSEDKNFEFSLAGQTDVTIEHNLDKYPAISVLDSAGDEVEGDYQHLSTTRTRLLFSAGFSGKAIFN